MKQTIQLRLGQQLTMTPQLQQAIKLLQLSTLDLQREIQEALDSNLMLEDAGEVERVTPEPNGAEALQPSKEKEQPERLERDPRKEGEVRAENESIPDELPLDSHWSDTYDSYPSGSGSGSGSGSSASGDDDYDLFAQRSRPRTLHDHLEEQLNLYSLDARDRVVVSTIIDAIDGDGYLRSDVDELLETLGDDAEELGIGAEEVVAALHLVQSLDPTGVGARDPRECLLLQLRELPDEVPLRNLAIRACEDHFDGLTDATGESISRALRVDIDTTRGIINLIRTLHPRPGILVADVQPDYVIPDVLVRKRRGDWQVELNPETMPRLRVNAEYAKLIRRADQTADNTCLKNHLQEAKWFIKSVTSRNDTVLRVAGKIVELQTEFLEHGEEAMKPLVLRDIADALGLHESTVSRVTTQKYMHTPRGTYEFKFFFSSHVQTSSGGECSSTAIRAFIRKFIAAESPKKPLSDNKIATVLSEQGIKVARRTVAKYREAMGIPPSNERKRLV